MNGKRIACLAGLLLALTACAPQGAPTDGPELSLYYLSTQRHGPALVSQPYHGEASPKAMIQALLAGPEADTLRSPYPSGLSLRGCKLNDGLLTVNFSEHYGGLADINLTLADYCLVLTVCQLDEVDAVEITVMGSPVPHRSHQLLTQEEALLILNPSLPSS